MTRMRKFIRAKDATPKRKCRRCDISPSPMIPATFGRFSHYEDYAAHMNEMEDAAC